MKRRIKLRAERYDARLLVLLKPAEKAAVERASADNLGGMSAWVRDAINMRLAHPAYQEAQEPKPETVPGL